MSFSKTEENPQYLTTQLITYLGNKRALLDFIGQGISYVQEQTGKTRLKTFDVFSGSGIVSRYLKQFSSLQYANDLEQYACIINRCYLSNKNEVPFNKIANICTELHVECTKQLEHFVTQDSSLNSAFKGQDKPGFFSKLYAPEDMNSIGETERCFYTPYNAAYLDIMLNLINTQVDPKLQHFFKAPLLSQASIHANTSGVFKGFYKADGKGKYGGKGENALSRIKGNIQLEVPVFSSFNSEAHIFSEDANSLVKKDCYETVDLAYLDPPYNQHPYGSNYFMLNLVADPKEPAPETMSRVSGIPNTWNHSDYNYKKHVAQKLEDLVKNIRATYLLISFNNEGFIPKEQMLEILGENGDVSIFEKPYNTFRGSRNLNGRNIHVKEYLYLLKKSL